jgi:hypothetical protein
VVEVASMADPCCHAGQPHGGHHQHSKIRVLNGMMANGQERPVALARHGVVVCNVEHGEGRDHGSQSGT